MDITRARQIIRSLAKGVDPFTGELLPSESIFNAPDVIRALYTIREATYTKSAPQSAPICNAGKPWTSLEDNKLRDEFSKRYRLQILQKNTAAHMVQEKRTAPGRPT